MEKIKLYVGYKVKVEFVGVITSMNLTDRGVTYTVSSDETLNFLNAINVQDCHIKEILSDE